MAWASSMFSVLADLAMASYGADLKRKEREAELERLSGGPQNVGFGSQIRSYVLAPYRQVKDERTRLEVGNVDAVLDGDIDQFIEAWLRWRRQNELAPGSDAGAG